MWSDPEQVVVGASRAAAILRASVPTVARLAATGRLRRVIRSRRHHEYSLGEELAALAAARARPSDTLTLNEVAVAFGISGPGVRALIAKGKLVAVRRAHRCYITCGSVDAARSEVSLMGGRTGRPVGIDGYTHVAAVAREWGLPVADVHDAIERGELHGAVPSPIIGYGGFVVRSSDVERWLERVTAPTSRRGT